MAQKAKSKKAKTLFIVQESICSLMECFPSSSEWFYLLFRVPFCMTCIWKFSIFTLPYILVMAYIFY